MTNSLEKLGLFFLISLCLSVYSVDAEEKKKLYKHVDEHGNVSFSDQPSKGSKEVPMNELPSIKIKKTELTIEDVGDQKGDRRDPNAAYYTVLAFDGLENDGVVRNNGGSVTLSVKSQPAISPGHSIKFYLDGKLLGPAQKESTVTKTQVEYGPHTASFEIVLSNGRLVQKSDTVSFHLLHVVRRGAQNINNVLQVPQLNAENYGLPAHPKAPQYNDLKKTDKQVSDK